MLVKVEGAQGRGPNFSVSLRCPGCRQQGTFEGFSAAHDLDAGHYLLGQRRCPNPACHTHIFFAAKGDSVVASYPAERLDFDSTNIPKAVVQALEEAITCYAADCFIAAAIMVRKTLEEICRDKNATGHNLKDRIKALSSKIMVPSDLIEGLDHLRLLGNDAAHIDSQTYQQVGKDECDIGITFTKEVLKAVYQYSTLVGRMKALQKPTTP